MKLKAASISALALMLAGASYYFYGGSATPAGQSPLVNLNTRNFSALKDAFNHDDNAVRAIVMLSPT